jgi:glycosyltransferase involved in cell wall biosynthesis
MKVLHILSDINPSTGGVSKAVVTIIEGLNKFGVESEVACINSNADNYLNDFTFKIYALGPGRTSWAFNKKLSRWLLININKYDRIIVHGLWQYHTFALYRALRKLKIKKRPHVYVMPHGMLDPWFQKAPGRKIKAIRNYIFWKIIEKNIINSADGLLFTCDTEMRLARTTFKPYNPLSEIVVGLGVSAAPAYEHSMTTAFEKSCSSKLTGSYVLFLGRIDIKKGVDDLVNAYISLQSNGVVLPKLVIAGPGIETDFGLKISKICEDNSDIIFTGMLEGHSKWGAFYGCDAFILPSHQENFGIAVVEALSCGRPVLISDQVNIYKEIEAGKSGIISSDTQAGAEKLLLDFNALSNNEKNQMGGNAKILFNEKFIIGSVSKKFLEIL